VLLGVIPRLTIGTPWEISTAPGSVTLTNAQAGANVSFGGFRRGTIAGAVFNDRDGNGVRDAGDGGLAGWRIFQDRNGNGVYDDGSPRATASTDVPKIVSGRPGRRSA